MSLPIVDISNFDKPTGEKLFGAASTHGFLYIEGHCLSQAEIDDIFDLSEQFFQLPLESKLACPRLASNYGYDYNGERLDPKGSLDEKQSVNFDVSGFLTAEEPVNLPHWFQDEKRYALMESIISKLNGISLKLLQLLALGLGIDPSWFNDRYNPQYQSSSTFRLLYYPKTGENNVRAGAHTDYGSMTLLFQKNQPGLEIYSPISSTWESVPFVKARKEEAPPIIVNIGDLLSYWTCGLLKSTLHRVKFDIAQDRYSIVYFSHPNDETLLEPIPCDLTMIELTQKESSYLTAKQHLQNKLSSTYDWK